MITSLYIVHLQIVQHMEFTHYTIVVDVSQVISNSCDLHTVKSEHHMQDLY